MTEPIDDFIKNNGEEFGPDNAASQGPGTSSGESRANAFGPEILSSADFVKGFSPPDYVISGILQRGFIYSITGPTGSGKTAILLRLLATVALDRAIGGHDVEQGRCLMLVGENPDDVRARWIALSEEMGFDVNKIDVHFMPGVFPLSSLMPLLEQKARELGGVALLGVDTGAAFFTGDNENDNKQQGDYARQLRTLTNLHGRPCVLVNCHPPKNATEDGLIPRGGGAFIAEVDGNLCCKRTEATVELHWQGKFRGPDFVAIPFELKTVTSDRLKDSKCRHMPTVIARPLTEFEHANREKGADRDLKKLLSTMAETKGASISQLAEKLGWIGATGEPKKSKVHRLLEKLEEQRLARKELNVWILTAAGEKVAKKTAS